MFILELTNKYGASMLIKAKFVERWLVKQQWGETPAERVKNFDEYMKSKDNRIVSIVNNIRHSKRGAKALEKAGLIVPDRARRVIPEIGNLLRQWGDQQVLEEERMGQQQAVRPREQSVEEQRLRRQHREAMVLNDGTRPLGREDIIEPDHESAH